MKEKLQKFEKENSELKDNLNTNTVQLAELKKQNKELTEQHENMRSKVKSYKSKFKKYGEDE